MGDYRGLITIFGRAHTPGSKIAVDERVRDAEEALRRLKLPIPPQFLVVKPVFDVVKSAASLVVNLVSPVPQAFKAGKDLFDLFSSAQDVRSWSDTSAFLEVHYRLGWTLREWFNSGIRLERLFGPIQNDEPGSQ
jgi:hypothetical protein